MTPDNVVSIAFVFAIFGAVLLKAAREVLCEAHRLVASHRTRGTDRSGDA